MSEPSQNPARQQLQLLLGAYGFNFYSDVTKARADDLLVRQAVSGHLTSATAALTRLEQAYRARFIPPSTRAQPFPPADAMQRLHEIGALKTRIGSLDARLRGGAAPTQDKVWWRVRDELSTLGALLSYDKLLVEQADLAQRAAESVTADQWNAGAGAPELETALGEIEQTLQLRERLLQVG